MNNLRFLVLVLLSLATIANCKTVRGVFSSRLARLYQGQYLTKFCFYGRFLLSLELIIFSCYKSLRIAGTKF